MAEMEIALQAAKKAGALLAERVGKIERLDYKGAFNIVTDVDRASEALIIQTIFDAFPDDDFLGEEGGLSADALSSIASKKTATSNNRRWIIDPLDGTTNFAHSYPFFAVSIAFEYDGLIQCGVVFNPMADETFAAERGKGAFLNGKPLKVSSIDQIDKSLLATGFPPDTLKSFDDNMATFKMLTNESHGVRRDGSAALDLAFVASGRLDGFWERKLSPWDIAAGSLIVAEAKGRVSNLEGGLLDMSTGHIIASNGLIHDDIVSSIARAAT
ncbi:hypothetical protein Lal_00039336 [Lupinus albus]|jgi:myo-inositol-1(or 4)-monophosphatase|nr:hypothetical protein Lal_00039336 [Lupinus albus]